DLVETWDGDPDTLSRWIQSIDRLARRSKLIEEQLGDVVPDRLKDRARDWFYTMPPSVRDMASASWTMLRRYIQEHFMNRAWLDHQKGRAICASYRDEDNRKETPSDYFNRKVELLTLVFTLSDSEIILEVMNAAPAFWRTIIDTSRLGTYLELQNAIKYHEEALM
ncbi:hypothetical protein CALVIDRAFT_464778, partial [Calocera viscosa TUFC12733]